MTTDHPDTDLVRLLRIKHVPYGPPEDDVCLTRTGTVIRAADALDRCHTRCADLEAALRWALDAFPASRGYGMKIDVGGQRFFSANPVLREGDRWVLEPEQDT